MSDNDASIFQSWHTTEPSTAFIDGLSQFEQVQVAKWLGGLSPTMFGALRNAIERCEFPDGRDN